MRRFQSSPHDKSFFRTTKTAKEKTPGVNTRLREEGPSTSSHSDASVSEGTNPLLVREKEKTQVRAVEKPAPRVPAALKEKLPTSSMKANPKKAPPTPLPAARKTGMPPKAEKFFGCLDIDAERASDLCASIPYLLPAIEAIQVVAVNQVGNQHVLSMNHEAALAVLEALVGPAPGLACKLFLFLEPGCLSTLVFMSGGPKLRVVLDSLYHWAADEAQPPVDIAPVRQAFFRAITKAQGQAQDFEEPMNLPGWMDACPAWALDEVQTMIAKENSACIEKWCENHSSFARAWNDLNERHVRLRDQALFKVTDLNTIPDEFQSIVDVLGIPEQEALWALEKEGGLRKLIDAIQECGSCMVTNEGQLAMPGDDAWKVINEVEGDVACQARFVAALHPDSLMALMEAMKPHRFAGSVSSWLHGGMSPSGRDALVALRQSYVQAFDLAVKKARQATGLLATRKDRKESMHALATLLEAAPDWLVFDLVAVLKQLEEKESKFLSLRWQTEEFSTAWTNARKRAEKVGRFVFG